MSSANGLERAKRFAKPMQNAFGCRPTLKQGVDILDATGPIMQPKDWTQRFEKAEQKPRVVRLVFGVLIVLSKISHFIPVNPDQPKGIMGLLDLWPPTNAEAIGYDLASTLLWLVAVWLIVTGAQPKKVTLPPEPK